MFGRDGISELRAEHSTGNHILARAPKVENFLSRPPTRQHVTTHHAGAHQFVFGVVVPESQRIAGGTPGVTNLHFIAVGISRKQVIHVLRDERFVQNGQGTELDGDVIQERGECLGIVGRLSCSEADDVGKLALLFFQQGFAGQRLSAQQGIELRIARRMAAAMQPVAQALDHGLGVSEASACSQTRRSACSPVRAASSRARQACQWTGEAMN